MIKLADDGKKGITVKVNSKLHKEVRQYLEDHGMTKADFVSLMPQNSTSGGFTFRHTFATMRP